MNDINSLIIANSLYETRKAYITKSIKKNVFIENSKQLLISAINNDNVLLLEYLCLVIGLKLTDYILLMSNINNMITHACVTNNLQKIKTLFDDIEVPKSHFDTVLNFEILCYHNHYDILIYMLEHMKCSYDNIVNSYGLIYICTYGRLPMLKYLHTKMNLTKKDIPDYIKFYTMYNYDIHKYITDVIELSDKTYKINKNKINEVKKVTFDI